MERTSMPAPNDRNDRIALAKGWRWQPASVIELNPPGEINFACTDHWIDVEGNIRSDVPDFVGTLEGVSGMLWELGNWEWLPMTKERAWWLPQSIQDQITEHFICLPHQRIQPIFISPVDRPGDCVGEAWLSMKEVVDASTE